MASAAAISATSLCFPVSKIWLFYQFEESFKQTLAQARESPMSLWRGYLSHVVRFMPKIVASFVIYDALYHNSGIPNPFLAGAAAGFFS